MQTENAGRPGDALHLGEALKIQTHDLHTAVERSGVMHDLLRGRVELSSYCLLLRNLHAIYRALEGALARHGGQQPLALLWHDGLARRQPLEDDLGLLYGPGWQRDLDLLPAAAAYVERMDGLDRAAPRLLLAHVYVRYLGDLSGGQILRDIVAHALGLSGADGTRFYDFGDKGRAADLARRFRAGLDAVVLDDAGVAAMVAEAQWSFAQHAELFRQISATGDSRRTPGDQ